MESNNETIKKITGMIKDIKVAMLTTRSSDGSLHSRPMTTQAHHFDGDVWFFSQSTAEVVSEIHAHPSVNVAYVENGNYVSIAGDATIVTDIAKKKALWRDSLKLWYDADSPESENIVLIHVKSISAQYWESPNGIFNKAVSMIKVLFTGKAKEMGNSRQVQLD